MVSNQAPDVHDRNTFVDVDNLTDAIQPESKTLEFHFDCLGHNPDGHRPILRQIAELTETEVALDEMLKQITVSGNTSNVEQASARLRNLDSAMVCSVLGSRYFIFNLTVCRLSSRVSN